MDPRMYPGGVSVVELSVNPSSVSANTTGETAVTVPGVVLGKSAVGFVNPGALTAGLGLAGVRVTADNQITVRFINTTAAPIDSAATVWTIGIIKYKS